MAEKQKTALSDKKMMMRAIKDSFIKLKPKTQAGNPVMLLVYLSAIMTTGLWLISLIFGIGDAPTGYTCAVAVNLWFTVLFANFAEAIAEGRGKAQADSLRKAKKDVDAHKIPSPDQKERITVIPSTSLKKGDLVLVKAGEQIPGDGEVVDGAASVDESAITGESAPVIRDSGGDRSAVTGGTTVLSDWIVVRITSEAGETFMDKMIAMVEGANRKKTPNEIALQIFLVALSIVFIMVTMSLYTYSMFSAEQAGIPNPTSITTLVALLVCLAPTTIGALLSAIGIAGMSRLNQANVLAMSGRAIEAAGDVDILMLDKTGTITLGNRRADAFIPVDGASEKELADAAQLSSLADETPEGRSVVVLAKEKFGIRERSLSDKNMEFVPFTAVTRMSGVNFAGTEIRKGAADAIKDYVVKGGGIYSPECDHIVKEISSKGGTPLVVAKNHIVLGVIYLKDIIKDGVQEKFADLRKIEKEKKLWSQTTISDMLKNEVYLGKTVWSKKRVAVTGSTKLAKNDREDWIIVEGTHEPIVSEELFAKANEMAFSKEKRPYKPKKKSHAILMCPSCGRRLDLTGSGKSYRCPQAHMTGLPECSNSKMDKVELEETVLACARNMVRFISENLEKKKKVWLETSMQEEKLSTLASEKKRLSSRKMKLYSDYRMGSLTKDQYISELEITTKRIAEIDQCIPEIENEIEEARKKIEEAGAKQAELNDIAALQSFDKNVLYKIIDKVYVYGGGRIEIIWKMDDIFFVGDKSKVIDVNEKKDE